MDEVKINYCDFECPYCEQEIGDSWEYEKEVNHLFECEECGKKFTARAEVSVSYITGPIEE